MLVTTLLLKPLGTVKTGEIQPMPFFQGHSVHGLKVTEQAINFTDLAVKGKARRTDMGLMSPVFAGTPKYEYSTIATHWCYPTCWSPLLDCVESLKLVTLPTQALPDRAPKTFHTVTTPYLGLHKLAPQKNFPRQCMHILGMGVSS